MNREELAEAIAQKRKEAQTAGKVHKRDLLKNVHRMEVELARYDRYRKGVA